jgi:hypothetical protein
LQFLQRLYLFAHLHHIGQRCDHFRHLTTIQKGLPGRIVAYIWIVTVGQEIRVVRHQDLAVGIAGPELRQRFHPRRQLF